MVEGKKVILHVIDALNIGGAQELLVLLAKKTPPEACRTLVCVLQPDLTIKGRLTDKGAEVFCLMRPRASILSPLRFLKYVSGGLKDIITICRRYKVDVVHCHLSDAEFIGIPAGRLAGVKRVVSTVHYPALLPERAKGSGRNLLRRIATRLLYLLADRVVAVSFDVAAQLERIFHLDPEKIEIIVNGIDVEEIGRVSPDPEILSSIGGRPGERLVLAVGRLMPPKGHRYLIEAMPALAERFKVRLLLTGDGDLRESLVEEGRSLGVGESISFLGSRDDIPELLAAAEVFVLPSVSEGTSLALLEAMAAAKPIVATDIPGNRGLLRHEHNSLLVPPGDPERLYLAIAALLADPPRAGGYGQNARKDVAGLYHIDKTVEKHLALWGQP